MIKREIINNVMTLYVMKHAMTRDGSKPYEPGTMGTCLRSIFGVFHENGIVYSLNKDFNYQGGFAAVLKTIWAGVSKCDPKFGSRPNRIVVELEDELMIEEAFEDKRINLENVLPVAASPSQGYGRDLWSSWK